MRIILEGPDASGKTQTANTLLEKYGFNKILKYSKDDANDFEYYNNLLESDFDKVIFDRFHISEMVYPEIYHREPKLSFEDFCNINNKIIANKDLVIVFYTSNIDILNKRLLDRKEFNYLDEIEQQNTLFLKYSYVIDVYEDMKIKFIDISKQDAYKNLYKWIEDNLED